MNMNTDKWDKRMIQMARLVATWSKDPSTQVGAVIADKSNRVISTGFNGFPRGMSDDRRLYDRNAKYPRIIHAEANAIMFARGDLTGCTLYVTHRPCTSCSSLIIQSGISRVVTTVPDDLFADRWGNDGPDLLNEVLIVYEEMDFR